MASRIWRTCCHYRQNGCLIKSYDMEKKIIIEPLTRAGQTVNIVKPEGEDNLGLPVLLDYLTLYKDRIDGLLLQSGAILFRGFDINDKDEFLKIKEVFSGTSNFDYVDGNSPRTKLSSE